MHIMTDNNARPITTVNSKTETYRLQCLAIHVFNLCLAPIKELRILQSLNHRTHVIFFLPHGHVVRQTRPVDLDPVIPLTTHDLGPQFRRAMRPLLNEMILWTESNTLHNQQQWGQRAANLVAGVINTLWNAPAKDLLTPIEREFMIHYLSLSVAVPYAPHQGRAWDLFLPEGNHA